MSRETLHGKRIALQLLLSENDDKATDYRAQIAVIDQELEDLGKPEATPAFLDKISETITEAVENLELDDGITCDLELDYDNKITTDNFCFENSQEIADKIYCAVELLFAEVSSDILEAQKADEACN